MRIPELTRAFNKKFSTDRSESEIKAALNSNKIRCGRKPGLSEGERYRLFTKKQAAFIKKSYRLLTIPQLTLAVNEKYGTKFTEQQLQTFTHNHHIPSGRTGCFEKGQKPWNAGTKGLSKPNSGCFQKGHAPANRKPLGAERVDSYHGYVLSKVAEQNPYTGSPTRYRPKHVIIWEQIHGPVPQDKILVFIDGDNKNINIDNLMLIDRVLHVKLNQNHYAQGPNELKPSVLLLCKLQTKISRLRKNRREK